MQGYVSMVKNLVHTGQQYITSIANSHGKPAFVWKIDKAATIYDAINLSSSQLDHAKCLSTLTNLICLFNHGEKFTEDESTKLFFSITKLFQSQDAAIRRLVYLCVKEMRAQTNIYIVTSSLLKDIHHKNNNFRRNALRTIPLVIDSSNLAQVERYIKGLIADADPGVASGALLSGIQMFHQNEEMIRKWGADITDKLNSKDAFVQYHALLLIGDVKKKDINSLRKLLFGLMKQNLTGIAVVQYLRMLRDLIKDLDYDSPQAKDLSEYLKKQICSRDDSVVIEACKLACDSPFMSNKDLLQVIKVMEPFLVSQSSVKQYAVLKIFNSLLRNQSRKSLVVNVKEIEKVFNGPNTSLSSIAASILLRICSQTYLQVLLQKILKTIKDVSMDYKIDVVRSLVNVLKTYPGKYKLINKFMGLLLVTEKSQQLRTQIIEVINFQIVQMGGIAKMQCILLLAKFMSIVEEENMHFHILGIISRQATKGDVTSEIFRTLITEVHLREGNIRACGVSNLLRLVELEEQRRDALEKTIYKFREDQEQQVRDRVLFRAQQKPISGYQLDLIENYLNHNCKKIEESTDASALSMDNIRKWGADIGPVSKPIGPTPPKTELQEELKYRQIFLNHPNFKEYGVLRKINKQMQVTDSQSELIATARIFLFDNSMVFEYRVENKMPNSILENVRINLKHSWEFFQMVHLTPAKSISVGQAGECYVGLKKLEDCEDLFPEDKISSIAKYTVKEMAGDVVKRTYEDEFSLDDFHIKLATYMSPWPIESSEFIRTWEQMKGVQQNGTFQLKYASTQAAEQELVKHFGIRVIENSDKNAKPNTVTVWLAGKYLGIHETMLILVLAFDTKMGCLMKIKAKSTNEELTEELIASIS